MRPGAGCALCWPALLGGAHAWLLTQPLPPFLLVVRGAGPWIGRHALHAAAITITHPRSGQPLTVRSPVPPDFLHAMAQLGLQHAPGAEFGLAAGEGASGAPAAATGQGTGAESSEQEAPAAAAASGP